MGLACLSDLSLKTIGLIQIKTITYNRTQPQLEKKLSLKLVMTQSRPREKIARIGKKVNLFLPHTY